MKNYDIKPKREKKKPHHNRETRDKANIILLCYL